MTTSTIERAYQLARAGKAPDVAALKAQLKASGYRAVDALLAAHGVRRHLEAICAATFVRPSGGASPPNERTQCTNSNAPDTPNG